MSWEPSESQGRPLKLWLERGREGWGGLAGSVASERGKCKELPQEQELRRRWSKDLLSPLEVRTRPG